MQTRNAFYPLLLATILVCNIIVEADAATLYVGTNWSGTQYADIQSAITAASAGDEIWVEQGTYSLGEGEYIDITKAISLYGGFTGSETSREQRNWTANVTTVDGNNIERCFVTKSTVTIDGFNIINGLGKEANLQSEEGGGGILNGVCTEWNDGSKSTKYCLNGTPGYLTIVNCTFSNNDSQKHGGAISSEMGSLNATNCTFSTNTAINRGGAINNDTDMTIDNCTFSENSASNGGALVSNGVSPDTGLSLISISITDCVFRKNTVDTDGSALLCDANIPVTGCIFDQNIAGRYGTFATRGDTGISQVFTNCVFSNNSALYGSALCVNGKEGYLGVVKAVNCTFAGNTLASGGKGSALYTMKPYSNSSTDFAVTNCILWGNDANAIDRSTTERPLPVVSYSDIDNSTAYAGTMSNCIHSNPLFVDAANGDYSLQTASPCINTGTATGAPADDILKTSRPQGSGFDMGAYESAYAPTTTSSTSTTTVASATTTSTASGGGGAGGGSVTTTSTAQPTTTSSVETTTTSAVTTTTTTMSEPPPETTTTTSVQQPCAATRIAGSQNHAAMNTLRVLRDRRLSRCPEGIALTGLYYLHGMETGDIVLSDPGLKNDFQEIIKETVPALQKALLDDSTIILKKEQYARGLLLLKRIKERSSPGLNKAITFVLEKLVDGRFPEKMKIRIVEE